MKVFKFGRTDLIDPDKTLKTLQIAATIVCGQSSVCDKYELIFQRLRCGSTDFIDPDKLL